MFRMLLAIVACSCCVQSALAQDEETENEQRTRWMSYYREQAATYDITRKGETDQTLEFQPNILFQYTNPVREYGQHGAFFVWTLDGRPEVIGTVWSTIDRRDKSKRNVAHELHSLSLAPLESKRPELTDPAGNAVPQWSTDKAGLKFTSLESKPPAKSPTVRLIQMRQIARQFSANSMHPKEDSPRTLRLMTQPIYRYESPSAKVIDGAIFPFVMGTDPELMLILEAHETSTGPKWHFAAARFTHIPTKLRYHDQVVWECGPAQIFEGDQPFFLYLRMIRLQAEFDLAEQ